MKNYHSVFFLFLIGCNSASQGQVEVPGSVQDRYEQQVDVSLAPPNKGREAAQVLARWVGIPVVLAAILIGIGRFVYSTYWAIDQGTYTVQHLSPTEGALYLDALQELDKLRPQLGGGVVQLRSRFAQDIVQRAIEERWQVGFFWKTLAKIMGMGPEGRTPYQRAHLQLTSLAALKANLNEIDRRLDEDDDPRKFISAASGLAVHLELNGNSGIKAAVKGYLELFEAAYPHAKQHGELEDFFRNGIKGACLEHRTRNLQLYLQDHPLEPMPDLSSVVDVDAFSYDENTPILRTVKDGPGILDRELHQFTVLHPDEKEDPFVFKAYLLNDRNIFQIRGTENGVSRLITKQDVMAYIQQAVEVDFTFDDRPNGQPIDTALLYGDLQDN